MTWPWDSQEEMSATANRAAELAGIDTRLTPEDILFVTEQLAPGYGQPSDAGLEALTLLARTEGILVEPTYTAKALAGLIADVRRGLFNDCNGQSTNVVFLHTGGTPAIFAEAAMLSERIARKVL